MMMTSNVVSAMELGRGRRRFQSLDLRVDVLQLVLMLKGDAHVEGHDRIQRSEFFVMSAQLLEHLAESLLRGTAKIGKILLNGLQNPQNDVVWLKHGTGSPFETLLNLRLSYRLSSRHSSHHQQGLLHQRLEGIEETRA